MSLNHKCDKQVNDTREKVSNNLRAAIAITSGSNVLSIADKVITFENNRVKNVRLVQSDI